MPANSHKPLALIDIDGVLSLYGFTPDKRPEGSWITVDGIAHYLSARGSEHLQALAEDYELVWCSGWEEKANEYLPLALGLPRELPFISFDRSPGQDGSHWKLRAIDEHAGPNRPLAWVDDALDERCEQWAARRPGPTLLVRVEPPTGLTGAEVERLREWARSIASAGSSH
jgi:hypothetical protein